MSTIGSPAIPAIPAPKQIRFVNNGGQPPPKRRRVTAACATCRKRKTRCDGGKPFCMTCIETGQECLGYENVADGGSTGKQQERKGSDGSRVKKNPEGDRDDGEQINSNASLQSGSRMGSSHERNRHKVAGETGTGNSGLPEYGDYRETAVFSDEDNTTTPEVPNHLLSTRHRVPYFRYFGPTAIVPGFKQMVVSVREHRRSTGAASSTSMSPGGSIVRAGGSTHGEGSSQAGTERRGSIEMPVYDPTDPSPVNPVILHLVDTFFAHLGCNYPFLRHEKFLQKVKDKSVEPILVDALCSLAARFSDHPLIAGSRNESLPKSEYGHMFTQRAKAAVVETFPCPTVAAVQACLFLAYEGFGAGQDSALWMYLGCAIRMAVDLGLQKLDGVKHQGVKDPGYQSSVHNDSPDSITAQEKQEVEKERTNTLWAVFMLDRVISSGTGRPVTLKDEDFELAFPAVTPSTKGGWPNPFPALIQITHLYGRVSDLLNNIRDVRDVTPKKIEGLAGMEKDLTQLYQRLDQRLTFNATNFQHYCKSGEGTNFILVHFWFHTLIMLLHQPTLMHSFEGPILQLLPNSRELSMSSAKTIADILSFAELIDIRSFIGNPFTSQPMYIAACAFLMESAAQSSAHPSSRAPTPPRQNGKNIKSKTTENK